MIFYFSGTGNSKYVASCMSDKNLINIGEANKKKEYKYEVGGDESVGFIFPVYYEGVPKPVLEFVRSMELSIEPTYVYCILTHGGGPGGTGTMLVKELSARNLTLHACFDVIMPSNYIMFSDLKPEKVLKERLENAPKLVEKIKTSVDNREHILPNWTALDKLLTASMTFLCEKDMPVKKFYADGKCTGCGMCAKECPAGLIQMKNGRPEWTENKCVRCMSCLKCPHVQYGRGTKNRRRYKCSL